MSLKRVLIVEDTSDIGRLYQETLRTAYPGLGISFVPSAEEAILETARYTFELMITDIRLPGMSGFDLVRKFRQRQPGVKIIMITGLSVDSLMQKRAADSGADLLLAKPVSVADFLSSVERITGEAPQVPISDIEAARPARRKSAAVYNSALNEPLTEPLPAIRVRQPQAPKAAPAVDRPAAESALSLGSSLSDLRGSLGALAAILLDDSGRPAAQAGNWPEPALETRLVPEVMASLAVFEKLSAPLHPGLPQSAHAVRGQEYDLVVAPVGRYALLVFLRSSSSALRLALAFEQVLSAQVELEGILEGMGLNIRTRPEPVPAAPETAAPAPPLEASGAASAPPLPEDPDAFETLENLLGRLPPQPVDQDPDAFWDNIVSGENPPAPASGALSYEQARKLGLLPDEE